MLAAHQAPVGSVAAVLSSLTFTAVRGMPEIAPGADLAGEIAAALERCGLTLQTCDVLVVAQKIISKAEGRLVDLESVVPSREAIRLCGVTGKDARLIEVILGQSEEVVRAAPGVLIVRHRLGFVMANAGVDRSNVPRRGGPDRKGEQVLLLPEHPDGAAAALRKRLLPESAAQLGIIVSDSFGRPWRRGVVNVALGCAGLPALVDRRGERDREGRVLEMTEVAFADALAAGAAPVMGEAAEGIPVVLARGLRWSSASEQSARALLRPREEDLFR